MHVSRSYALKGAAWLALLTAGYAVAVRSGAAAADGTSLALLALCFIGGLIDTGLGMGYGTLVTPVLLLLGYGPSAVVPAVLVSQIATGFSAGFFHSALDNIDLRLGGRDLTRVGIIALGSVVGVALGYGISINLAREPLTVTIGAVIAASGAAVLVLRRHQYRYRHWKMWLLATLASGNKTISGGGYGPLVTSGQILSGVSGRAAVGITMLAEALTSVVAAVLYVSTGGLDLALALPITVGALASVPFAAMGVKLVDESHLKLAVGMLTVLIGLALVAETLL